jgi:uncharacterized protein YebE (UPF0316 family)
MMIKAHLIAFFATVIWHIVYIYVVKAIARNRTYLATSMNMIAWVLYAKITIDYVDNNWLLLSSMLGAGVGTFITMKFLGDVKTKEE